jgi:hypothetical protein
MTAPAQINSPLRCITYAMKDAGLLGEGDDPNSEQLAEGLNRLNDLINLWITQGLKLWLMYDLNVPLVAGTSSYTIGPSGDVNMVKPLRCLQGYYNDTTDATNPVRRPIFPLSWDEYLRLSTVQTQGSISQYFVDKQQTYLKVFFWNTPDTTTAANGTAHLLIEQQATNAVNLTETLNFPQEWFIAARWGLAAELCSGQSEYIIQRCEMKAKEYRTMLEDWDVEDASVYFKPDSRAYSGSRFR